MIKLGMKIFSNKQSHNNFNKVKETEVDWVFKKLTTVLFQATTAVLFNFTRYMTGAFFHSQN